jgi:Flp pilus assembly protein TadD
MHYQLGVALRKLGQTEEATTHLAEARRLGEPARESTGSPDSPGSESPEPRPRRMRLSFEGSPLAELTPPARAELRRRAVEGLARAYLNLGVLQAQSPTPVQARERFAKAAALFASAAEVDPDFPNVQSSLGVASFNARQFEQAIAPLERARAASPNDPGLRHMLAMSLLNTGAWERAADLLRGDQARETDASLQSAYALALVRGGRGAEAESVLARLIAQKGESAELLGLLGQAHAQQGKDGLAVETLEAATRLDPDDAALREELGRAYRKVGKTTLADREFEAARRLKDKRTKGTS